MSHRNLRNIALQVLVWFTQNIDEELLTTDIADRFDVSLYDARCALFGMREQGWLESDYKPGPGQVATWRPGPRLLAEVRR
jgi:DNA-binding IclR family transcriptional regulator